MINIREAMKKWSKFKVSKKASDQYESFVLSALEHNMTEIDEMVKANGRKTIMEEDVIKYFSSFTHRTSGYIEGPI